MGLIPSAVLILLFVAAANAANGYNDLLVAISEDVEQPADGGVIMINNIKVPT